MRLPKPAGLAVQARLAGQAGPADPAGPEGARKRSPSARDARIGRSEQKERTSSNLAHVVPSQNARAPLALRARARAVATSASRTSRPSSSNSVLGGVGTLIIFSFRNRDDLRNQSNTRLLVRRVRLRRFRCRRDGDSDRRIGFRGDRDRYLTRHPRGGVEPASWGSGLAN